MQQLVVVVVASYAASNAIVAVLTRDGKLFFATFFSTDWLQVEVKVKEPSTSGALNFHPGDELATATATATTRTALLTIKPEISK